MSRFARPPRRSPFDYHTGYGETLEDAMGCDIHLQIEERRDGRWEPIRPPVWDDGYLEEFAWEWADDPAQAIDMLIPPYEGEPAHDPDETEEAYRKRLRQRAIRWLREQPFDRMWERHHGHNYMRVDFMDSFKHTDERGYRGRSTPEQRDYSWFGFLCAGVRAKYPYSFPERGLPDDATVYTRCNSDKYGPDGHSHSWVMVSEILASPGASHHPEQVEWLCANIPVPEETRLVFWFDN